VASPGFEAPPPRPAPKNAKSSLASGKPEQTTATSEPARQEASPPSLATRALLDAGIPWQSCTRLAVAPQPVAETAPVEITADSAEASVIDEQALFSGNVDLLHGHDRLRAARIALQRGSGELTASGGVLLNRPDLRLSAEQVHYNLHTRLGHAEQTEYRLPGILARGTAARAELTGPDTGRYQHITYTTCPPGNDDWQLSAETLDIDTREGVGTAHSAWLAFKGAPIAYAPVLTFPIDDRRHSGFLIPSMGYNDRLGLDLSLPYYFNLAPNYDLTLTPRLLGQRGLLLGGEFRFLTQAHSGTIQADYIHNDKLAPGNNKRGSLSVEVASRLSRHLSSKININQVSDGTFLSDFGSNSPYRQESYLERSATLDYYRQGLSVSTELQAPQTINKALPISSRPYATLPRINVAYGDSLQTVTPIDYALAFEYVNFVKSGSPTQGHRFDIHSRFATPIQKPWYSMTPALGLRYTAYRLNNTDPLRDANPDRLVPTLEIDNRLFLEREVQWWGTPTLQTLEPRLLYVYTPRTQQSNIPIFDTAKRSPTLDSLFLTNRFTSVDRIGDANHLAWSISSSSRNTQTRKLLSSFGIGQIIYLSDRKVQLPGDPVETTRISPLFANFSLRFPRDIISDGQIAWNENKRKITHMVLQAAYRPDQKRLISMSYSTTEKVSSEYDLGISWPVGERTRAIARWNYSLSERRNLDSIAGIEYGKCCWRLRALVRQQVTGTGNAQDLSFLLQLELNGLGKLGDNIDALLKSGIYGYR